MTVTGTDQAWPADVTAAIQVAAIPVFASATPSEASAASARGCPRRLVAANAATAMARSRHSARVFWGAWEADARR